MVATIMLLAGSFGLMSMDTPDNKEKSTENSGCEILNPVKYSKNGKRVVTWRRIATTATANTSNNWASGPGSGACSESSRICTAQFEDGYDPNDHDYATNLDEAITFVNGFKTN